MFLAYFYFKQEIFIFTEYGIKREFYKPITTINKVIDSISEDLQYKGIQTIFLLDEILAANDKNEEKNHFNMEDLKTSNQSLDLLLAVNPAANNKTLKGKFDINPPKNVYSYCLRTRHRNNYMVGVMLQHYQGYYQKYT